MLYKYDREVSIPEFKTEGFKDEAEGPKLNNAIPELPIKLADAGIFRPVPVRSPNRNTKIIREKIFWGLNIQYFIT
jgi:hypothetical protein